MTRRACVVLDLLFDVQLEIMTILPVTEPLTSLILICWMRHYGANYALFLVLRDACPVIVVLVTCGVFLVRLEFEIKLEPLLLYSPPTPTAAATPAVPLFSSVRN